MNLANCITLTRLLFGPLFLIIYLQEQLLGSHPATLPVVLIVLCSVAFLSDIMDGYVARKYDTITNLGKLLDPMTDSLATISIFLTFTLDPIRLPMPLVFVFIYRDTIMATLRTLCALKGVALAASITGKIKTILQDIACFILLGLFLAFRLDAISQATLHEVSTATVAVAAAFSLYSGIEYLVNNWILIRSEIK